MLFANRANRHALPFRILDSGSENRLAQEDSFAVMSKRAVSQIGDMRLALVEPIVDREIVFRFTAEQSCRPDRMMVGMRHGSGVPGRIVMEYNIDIFLIGDCTRVKIDDDGAAQHEFAGAKSAHYGVSRIFHHLPESDVCRP